MKIFAGFTVVLLMATFLTASCKVSASLPSDAIVLDQIIYADEVMKGVPQTVQMPDGTTFTYKMPKKLADGQIIKIRDIPGKKPYYIRIHLRFRDEQKK